MKTLVSKFSKWKFVLSGTLLVCTLMLLITQIWAAPIGQGSYTTTLPAGASGPANSNGNPVLPKVTNDFDKTILTNQWWSSLIWQFSPNNPYSENLYAHPLAARAAADGLGIGYPTYVAMNNEYHANYLEDMRVGLVGLNSPDTRVADYSDWTVTARWDGGGQLEATLGHGLPFVYFTKSGGNVNIDMPTGYEGNWYNQNGVLGVTINGHHYGIFAPSGSNWNASPPFQSNLNGQNYFSVAVLPNNNMATLEFYRQHAYAFITDTQVAWNYDEATANLQTTYTAVTELKESGNGNVNQPLMAMYRHQWINSNTPTTSYTYFSPRGEMKVIDGATFSTNMRFNGVLPALPDAGTYDRNQLYAYVNEVYSEILATPIQPSDTYWGGKAVGRLAALVPIAEQVGHTAARDEFLAQMKRLTEDWLNADDGQPSLIYYDENWDTAIGYPASYFADTQLNDHHFHWGYWIMAAATIAQYDPAWASQNQWGGMIDFIIRDATSMDRNDPMFPFLRYFDIYAGHGWANGPALFAAGNNQESSSEGMNYATAVILWGIETNNTALRDLGIYMYANTVSAIEQYWFDVDEQVFPPGYDYETIAIVWGNGGAYSTWWTANVEAIHGINFLPFSGGSLYLGRHPSYVTRNYNHLVMRNGGPETEWLDIIWQFQALADPAAAVAKFGSGNYTREAGESKAHTYHWLHNLNALGQLDTTVTANSPTYAVFNNNGSRTYVAYNANSSVQTVYYSDGKCLDVNPGEIASGVGYTCGNPPATSTAVPPTATNAPGTPTATSLPPTATTVPPTATQPPAGDYAQGVNSLSGSSAQIWFDSMVNSAWVDVHYTVNNGGQQNLRMVYNNSSNRWQWDVNGLSNGDTISYWFTYEKSNLAYNTGSFSYTHNGTVPTATNVPPTATAVLPTSTSIPPTATQPPIGDYSQGVDSLNGSTAQIWFDSMVNSAWVDVHYTVNGGNQQNLRMVYNSSNSRWQWNVNGLSNGAVISYWFTYEKNNLAYDTGTFSYTHNGTGPTATAVPPTATAIPPTATPDTSTFSGSGSGGSYTGDISYNGSVVTIRVQSNPTASNILFYPTPPGGGYFMSYDANSNMFVHQLSGFNLGDTISFHFVIQSPGQWEPGITHNWTVSN